MKYFVNAVALFLLFGCVSAVADTYTGECNQIIQSVKKVHAWKASGMARDEIPRTFDRMNTGIKIETEGTEEDWAPITQIMKAEYDKGTVFSEAEIARAAGRFCTLPETTHAGPCALLIGTITPAAMWRSNGVPYARVAPFSLTTPMINGTRIWESATRQERENIMSLFDRSWNGEKFSEDQVAGYVGRFCRPPWSDFPLTPNPAVFKKGF